MWGGASKLLVLLLVCICLLAVAAEAQTGAPATSSAVGPAGAASMSPFQFILGTVNFFLIAFLVYFMLVLRPLQLKQDRQSKFISSLKAGDKVMTSGGIYAKVIVVNPNAINLEIAAGTKITIHPEHVREIPSEPVAKSATTK